MVLDKYVEMVEAASSPHGNDCIVYMRLGTHSRKRFFDNWESLGVGDSCLNSDRDCGGAVKPCTYDRVTGLFYNVSQEQCGRGYLTLGVRGIRVRLEGMSFGAIINMLLLFK